MPIVTVIRQMNEAPSNREQAQALALETFSPLADLWLEHHEVVPDCWALLVHAEGHYAPGKAGPAKRLAAETSTQKVSEPVAVAIAMSDEPEAERSRHCVYVFKGKSGGPVPRD